MLDRILRVVRRNREFCAATALLVIVTFVVGCGGGGGGRSFEAELQLTLRAGRGDLSDVEKQTLLRENHPLLAQIGDPQAFPLLELFSRLPEQDRQSLLDESYVKWRMSELEPEVQQLNRGLINLVMKTQFGTPSPLDMADTPELATALLEQTEVGFAVIELAGRDQKVVSWFAFGPKLPNPMWVTIVNPAASRTPEYVQAHIQRLPLLRSLKSNQPPRIRGPLPMPMSTSMV